MSDLLPGSSAFGGAPVSIPEMSRVVDALQQMIKMQGLLYSKLGPLTAAAFAALDLSGLPTADPGGGKPWLNGGVLQVGP